MKNKYTTPQLTVVEFRAEKGFAESLVCVGCGTVQAGSLWLDQQMVQALNMDGHNSSASGIAAGQFHSGSTSGWGFSSNPNGFDFSSGTSHF